MLGVHQERLIFTRFPTLYPIQNVVLLFNKQTKLMVGVLTGVKEQVVLQICVFTETSITDVTFKRPRPVMHVHV